MFFAALQWILAVSQIGNREVYLRIVLHLFRIHHFVVWSIAKYLIAPEVLAGFCQEKYRLGADYRPPPTSTRSLYYYPADSPIAAFTWLYPHFPTRPVSILSTTHTTICRTNHYTLQWGLTPAYLLAKINKGKKKENTNRNRNRNRIHHKVQKSLRLEGKCLNLGKCLKESTILTHTGLTV